MQFWALLVDSFRESRDRKIFWVMLILSVVGAGAMACVAFEPGKINLLFGMWEYDVARFTGPGGVLRSDLITTLVVEWLMDTLLGWIGVLLAIIATAGFIPAMMERGAIEVLVSKPIARWRLFLSKYLSAMVFILIQAAVFVLLTFLVAGLCWRTWLPAYLLAIPLVVALYSYVYCVAVLVAVFSRSTIAAVLVTLGAWVAFAGVQNLDDAFILFPDWQKQRTLYQIVHGARWVVPKTQDITYLAKKWTRAAYGTELVPTPDEEGRHLLDKAEAVEAERKAIPAYQSIGSSLLFEAALVLVAMWRFSRQDF